jgi:hypothetical protein
MKIDRKNEYGLTLLIVIFVGAIIMLLAVAVSFLGLFETKSHVYVSDDTQAYYIAKSGAESLVAEIIESSVDGRNTSESFTLTEEEMSQLQYMTGSYGVIDENTLYNVYSMLETDLEGNFSLLNIDSYGVHSEQYDNLRLAYEITESTEAAAPLGDLALFSEGNIDLAGGGSTIIGGIETNAWTADSIYLKGSDSYIDGSVLIRYPVGTVSESKPDPEDVIITESTSNFPDANIYEGQVDYSVILLPDPPVLDLAPTGYYDKDHIYHSTDDQEKAINGIKDGDLVFTNTEDGYFLDLSSIGNIELNSMDISDELVIYTGDQECTIVTKSFDIQSNGGIEVTGTGTLNIFVTDEFYSSGNLNYYEPLTPDELTIYYSGTNSNKIKFLGGWFSGAFYTGEISSISLSGVAGVNGAIISGASEFNMTGCGDTVPALLLYAPNATLVYDGQGNPFYGMAIVAEADISNGDMIYSENFFPDDVESSEAFLDAIEDLIPENAGGAENSFYTFENPVWEDMTY